MRSAYDHSLIDALAGYGRNASEIARLTGIPRSTVRDQLSRPPVETDRCPFCGRLHPLSRLPESAYAYLLGMYLGDGTISRAGERCYRLRITTDASYPGVIEECRAAVRAVVPFNRVAVRRRNDGRRAVEVSAYSNSWPCLFPQHGSGKKHRRRIALEQWQQEIVNREPKLFLRGLLHSDGCRVLNRVGDKAYPRYFFSQLSLDIREMFVRACLNLGITVTATGRQLSISRGRDVAFVDTFVGAKT